MSPGQRLDRLRGEIDQLDVALVALLEQRASVAREIGWLKYRAGVPVEDPGREAEVIARVVGAAQTIAPAALRQVFCAVIGESRRVQQGGRA